MSDTIRFFYILDFLRDKDDPISTAIGEFLQFNGGCIKASTPQEDTEKAIEAILSKRFEKKVKISLCGNWDLRKNDYGFGVCFFIPNFSTKFGQTDKVTSISLILAEGSTIKAGLSTLMDNISKHSWIRRKFPEIDMQELPCMLVNVSKSEGFSGAEALVKSRTKKEVRSAGK